VAQGVGPEFKPQYCKKEKEKQKLHPLRNEASVPACLALCQSPGIQESKKV
jgi:hypothetical protein